MTSISLAEYRKQYGGGRKTAVKRPKKVKSQQIESIGESTLAKQLRALKINFEQEYQFHPKRKWRADFHIIGKRILVEVEGGIWSGGRHTRGKGYLGDLEKYNAATMMGYQVLRFSTEQVKSGLAVQQIERMVGGFRMNVAVKTQVMDWSKFTAEEWFKQYGAYIQICRMKSGNEPDNLGVNQIYWLICENNKGVAPRKDQIICKIGDFEAEHIRKLIVDFKKTSTVCESAKVAVLLFIEKNIRGLSDRKMEDEFKLGRNCLKNMVCCGEYYLLGHDKRLRIE